jgi:selenocysteine-specific elongation factor
MPDEEPGLKHLILATAGHVDHGKTALIKALTGTDTDRLPEEKARGITIDLGFAHLALPGLSIGVIDVPGHEDFVRNMIAGMGSVDFALLVVAADDGWMPQTEEHLQILHYLGVEHGVVALSKCDLADRVLTGADLRRRLRGTSLGEAPIVQTSARTGRGLEELKDALTRIAAAIPPPPDLGKPRLSVDRAFTARGIGTVVTGTLTGGQLRRGEAVILQPQNLPAQIRAIQSHNRSLEIALPATRTALNLPGLRPEQLPRGSVVTASSAIESSRAIDVLIERSQRDPLPARPLRNASVIQVHYGSARFTARILLLEGRELLPGDRGIARLRCTTPVFAYLGDRLILRDSSGRRTVAGGVILDRHAKGTRFRSRAQRSFLAERATAPNDLLVLLRTQLKRDRVCQRRSLLLQSNFSAEEIATAIERLRAEGKVFVSGAIVADGSWWGDLRRRAMAAIDAEHAARPEQTGLDLNRFRAALALDDAEVSRALLADLGAHDFSASDGMVRRKSHRPSLPALLEQAGARIRAALAERPFDPPSRKEFASDLAARQALRFLTETNEVILLNEDVALSAAAFSRLKTLVAQSLRERGSATVSELRQVTGTTRRVIVPFLERLDRLGLTIRNGDRRKLR